MMVILIGVLYKDDFSTWLPPLVSGIEGTVLLSMCIYYWLLEYRRKKNSPESQHLLVNYEQQELNKESLS